MEDSPQEETTGAVTRKFKPDKQKDSRKLLAERDSIKTARMLIKKGARSGKMSYVTKLISVVNKQVLNKSELSQVGSNLLSLKKATTNFRNFNDEYVTVLEDPNEIEGAFESLINIEDNFQKCMRNAEKWLVDCKLQPELEGFSRKSGKYSITSSEAEEANCDRQDPVKREMESYTSAHSRKIDLKRKRSTNESSGA